MKNSNLEGLRHTSGRRWWVTLLAAGFILFFALTAILTIVPAAFPGMGANVADGLRAVIGPKPVAELESLSFGLHDEINRFISTFSGGQPQINFNNQVQTANQVPAKPSSQSSKTSPNKPVLLNNDAAANPSQIEWQAYGPNPNGTPLMERAMVMIDPQRSYTGVALVRMDLTKLRLHLMPGTIEPGHPSQISRIIPDLGLVPPSDQSLLIAAFNGGFKGIHGHYGMMVNGLTILPALPNMATVAIYKDGHVAIGAWQKNIFPSPDMIAFRQNCPSLIVDGQINPDLYLNNRMAWGYTANTDITWRTGLGITKDGKYLIYAVSNGTSATTLANALFDAGAYNAMQLDINQYYAHFYTYTPANAPTASNGFSMMGQPLLDQMIYNPHLYLSPTPRDFFYLTLR